ncbi:exportin-2-like [Actinia tenebrosa]|uniref:Exportin-2 n=1 Tax=Actinia tenebrosa TaxID=6105 RepID=A0A6P8HKY8_ACTTE|nr:exportin-2-like [Actinia tenebrosa]
MDSDLQTLVGYLQQTLSPDTTIRKQAEKFLESVEGTPNFAIMLLKITNNQNVDMTIRVCATVTFKNMVKRCWRIIEGEPIKINEADRAAVKREIVDLMLKSPEKLQKQLSDAISIIGHEDFPKKWDTLLPEMVKRLESGDFHIINGVLVTAHSLFKRYRHEFKSQELWEEIKLVLEQFAQPLTNLFKAILENANKCGGDHKTLQVIFSSILLICKLFYSLNFQDLPEHFEDNMEVWMKNFLILLSLDNKILDPEDREDASLLELVKSQICDNVALYAQKYDEEFESYLPEFVKAIWNLLITTGSHVKHDLLVSNAIQFLASVTERPNYKNLFEAQDTLQSICEKVIVPNMEFRDEDEEIFEDNPEEYIRRDIEGSDVDTRRRAACDLVRGLSKFHEQPVTAIFHHYVMVLLEQYQTSNQKNWKSKDAAIFLVTSLASKKQTAKHGTTKASEFFNLQDFYTKYIYPELERKNVDEHPVLKADSIKYVITFRSMLSREILVNTIPILMQHLKAKSMVVHTYAAHCLERLLTLKNPGGGVPITKEEVTPIVNDLIQNLFGTLTIHGSEENEYVMKAIMRTLSLLQETILPFLDPVLLKISEKLVLVAKNPSKPHFNHYLFESICCMVRTTCASNPQLVAKFELALFPIFQEILSNDVTEFLPYVFQVLSLLLEIRLDDIPEPYMQLFPLLLTPLLWERTGNIPPLVRLLQAYIQKGSKLIIASNSLDAILGVFQKLIASKLNDHEGFYLLSSMVENMDRVVLVNYIPKIFILLFHRLQSSKTTKFVKGLLEFFCLYAVKNTGTDLIDIVDGIQPKLFGTIIEKYFIPDIQKVSGDMERKICAVGITKLLCEPTATWSRYPDHWGRLLQALIQVFELPKDDSVPDDEHFIEIEDTPGYQTAYSKLIYAGKNENDPFGGGIPNAKLYLVQSLVTLSQANPGKVMPIITEKLHQDAVTFLQKYLQEAGLGLS